MDLENLLGLIAGTLTTVSFFPQVLKAWKTRSTHDVSVWMFALLAVGILMWIAYGLIIHSLPVIIANAVSFVFVAIILGLKALYK